MGCKDNTDRFDGNCVTDALRNIKDIQDAVEDECSSSCFSNLLSPVQTLGDTIPFVLYGKGGKNLFVATGNVGGFQEGPCFQTPFFRIRDFHRDCATLQLLRPFDRFEPISVTDEDELCDVTRLVKTDFCIEVDLSCFCAIQCLDPRLLSSRHHHHDCRDESSSSCESSSHHHRK
ncbi:CotY/CotZ family spore coat protein [Aureibacillus halotolerans]|uniref:Spore coat protein Z n=1 Tax=Aureibacillus halotolerans TaxID=1508390 RepID=A0A4R6U6M1_9BACI|nr:CotY/CotZ family spore coat protein [Aureibacillus halotolerans]TDQ42150.1 spore coat protein Z [Aureibacillus halotolerans]